VKNYSLRKNFKSVDGWVDHILSFPGINSKELVLRKNYWYFTIVCGLATVLLTIIVLRLTTVPKVLVVYGILVISGQFLTASIFLLKPHKIMWLMITHIYWVMFVTFVFIVRLGGIPYSGGLVFIGFGLVFFTLTMQSAWIIKQLISVYLLAVIITTVLQPFLPYPPVISERLNFVLFAANISWLSITILLYLLRSIRQNIEIEHNETNRLKELDDAKTKLFTNITHEFRTPLTIILGMANLVKDKPDEWLEEGVEKIRHNGQNLLQLVNQMLDLSKLESDVMPLHIFQQDIVNQMRYLSESFNSLAKSRNIRMQFIPEYDHFLMDYDTDKMMHIVTNLFSNALKYTREGGTVVVKTDILSENGSNKFLIRVQDNGPGIPPEHLPYIFDRFYRIEDDAAQFENGSGLGLALTKELVNLMKGSINVESSTDYGTAFTVKLPVTNNAPLKEMAQLSDVNERVSASLPVRRKISEGKAKTEITESEWPILLIVEDNLELQEYLNAILKHDYHLEFATNGNEGLQKAFEYIPDIVLSDVMMPEMDGIAMLGKLKNDQRTSHIPVVMLTAKADISSKLTGLERGADDYLAKPFNEAELHVRLKKLVELRKVLRQRYVSMEALPKTEDKAVKIEDAFMMKIRNIMEAHLDNDQFGIQQLCKEIGMSRAQLYRKFKSLTDKTVNDYLINFRLYRAKEILLKTDLHVSEVAYEVGFKNLSHFSRAFREAFGQNPSGIKK